MTRAEHQEESAAVEGSARVDKSAMILAMRGQQGGKSRFPAEIGDVGCDDAIEEFAASSGPLLFKHRDRNNRCLHLLCFECVLIERSLVELRGFRRNCLTCQPARRNVRRLTDPHKSSIQQDDRFDLLLNGRHRLHQDGGRPY